MALTLYKHLRRLTPVEQSYLRRNPHHALTIYEAQDAAYTETQRRFGRAKGTNQAISLRCMAALRSGQLKIIEK